MKRNLKRIIIGLLVVFVLIQFIRPVKNSGNAEAATDILHVVAVPDTVKGLLKESCYDCHANYTRYPWYAEVAPMSWLLADHVKEGKQELNFSEFANLSPRRMRSKLTSIAEQVEKREMPLGSYTLIHTNAKLNDGQRKMITDWVDSAKQELSLKNR